MKFKIVFTPEARDDLVELYEYIAKHGNPERAIAYIERIEKACMSLQTLPEPWNIARRSTEGFTSHRF